MVTLTDPTLTAFTMPNTKTPGTIFIVVNMTGSALSCETINPGAGLQCRSIMGGGGFMIAATGTAMFVYSGVIGMWVVISGGYYV